jgi:hypothetical protein
MALVSPGIQISINDQSQYVSNAVGSVPLVLLATAQDKTYNGAIAAGTSKANAGKLQSFTSQRDLVTAFGTPTFELSASGSPVHAGELNEYGLMTAYSALGLGNQLFAIRADVDLDQLTGTSVRPTNLPASGTYWLDTDATDWGIHELNRSTNAFDEVSITYIERIDQVELDETFTYNVPRPKQSVGVMGTYAIPVIAPSGNNAPTLRLWYKTGIDAVSATNLGPGSNTWVLVGSEEWQLSIPVITGTVVNPVITVGQTVIINGETVIATGTTAASLVSDIKTAAIAGVYAEVIASKVALYCTTESASNGVTTDGALAISSGTLNISTVLGITADTYYSPYLFYGNYAETPAGGWFGTDSAPRPSRSIWWKLGATGGGFNPVLRVFNATTGRFDLLNTPVYNNFSTAVYRLDPTGGGVNIQAGQTIAVYGSHETAANGIKFAVQLENTAEEPNGQSHAHGAAPGLSPFATTIGDSFTISASQPGTLTSIVATVTMTGTTAETFVADLLGANIPYVTAGFESSGAVYIEHQLGGQILMYNVSGTPLEDVGFAGGADGLPVGGAGFNYNIVSSQFSLGKLYSITARDYFKMSASAPYATPVDGTYWYYSNPAEVDIMINDNGWKGYRTVSSDSRGYNLTATDTYGVIVSATEPTLQTDATALVLGDLWLDSSDLVNYPKLYRYNGSVWATIDTTDSVTSNGIIFADARWDTSGSTDVVSGDLPRIIDLAVSNYIDIDAPDYRLYPRGTLLFNTRRSGYNVKRFASNYFNIVNFPDDSLPTVADTWISASGLNANGSMKSGQSAQRAIVVAALSSAIDSNLEIREDLYEFNLLVAPGYPELIDNMVTLNTDRGETAFVIGDTPITLAPTATAISNWNSNTNGMGLATASPYLGVYYPSGLTTDLSGNTVAVPASHAVLRTFLYSDNVSYPWFAPAGTHRGLVSNIQDVGYVNASTGAWVHNSIGQGLRDSLYTMSINPVTQLPGVGIVVWGQETKGGTSTARDRVNVVRLENYLRKIFKSVANGYLFEPNDQITRKSIASQIESSLNDILSKRGVYDFLVVCDSTNNTSSTIANNQLYVDVAIEPARDVEFIYIPIALYNPGALASLGTSST